MPGQVFLKTVTRNAFLRSTGRAESQPETSGPGGDLYVYVQMYISFESNRERSI
jgi:hypothetical protein